MTTVQGVHREELVDLVQRGKRAKSRSAVGIAHGEWVRALPTIGYWWAVLLVVLLRGTFSTLKPSKDKDPR